jgi:GxxExxY protein
MDDLKEQLRKSLGIREPSVDADRCAYNVIGAAIEVHKTLGAGFPEDVYETALAAELEIRGIAYTRQVPVEVRYKGRPVGSFKLDLLVEDILVVELKSVSAIATVHVAQTIAYLKATNLHLGVILNFNVGALRDHGIRRVVRSR